MRLVTCVKNLFWEIFLSSAIRFGVKPVAALASCLLVWLAAAVPAMAQEKKAIKIPETTPRMHWDAQWISHPTAPLREPITLHFKKMLVLTSVPQHYLVHVSADNRFVLYLNGQRVGDGPARGDLAHWRYATYDLAPLMTAGANTLAANVWKFWYLCAGGTDYGAHCVLG